MPGGFGAFFIVDAMSLAILLFENAGSVSGFEKYNPLHEKTILWNPFNLSKDAFTSFDRQKNFLIPERKRFAAGIAFFHDLARCSICFPMIRINNAASSRILLREKHSSANRPVKS